MEFKIETGLRDDMIRSIRDRIIHNLEATKRFLELGEDYKDICAGIYTYAVEEYGKIRLLTCMPVYRDNTILIPYIDGPQGFLNHRHKIDLALNALPYCCKLISRGSFSSASFSSKSFTHNTVADFEARKSVFYVDFDKNNNYSSIVSPPQVKRDLLVKAVEDFLEFIRAQKYP